MKEFTCSACGKVFQGYRKIRSRYYCSRECFFRARKAEQVIVKCEGCGNPFGCWSYKKRKYCSASCFYRSRIKPKIPRTCKVCGKEFYRASLGPCCSRKCGYAYLRGRWRDYYKIKGEKISGCYMKEADAIQRGLHWEGKNRCVDLPETLVFNRVIPKESSKRKCKKCGTIITSTNSRLKGLCSNCDLRSGWAPTNKTLAGVPYITEVRDYLIAHPGAAVFDVALELHYGDSEARRLMKKAGKDVR